MCSSVVSISEGPNLSCPAVSLQGEGRGRGRGGEEMGRGKEISIYMLVQGGFN